jgi:antitoxin component YwqK of YwqJK toxin-antitoxin module
VSSKQAADPEPAIDYYPNGNVRFRGANLTGRMHGPWEFFRSDGSIMRSGLFDRGKQVGVWRTFDRSGAVVKETTFKQSSAIVDPLPTNWPSVPNCTSATMGRW